LSSIATVTGQQYRIDAATRVWYILHGGGSMTTLAERSRLRRARITAHRSHGFDEAEQWDLEFWQKQSPEDRLSALVAIHRDVAKVNAARRER